MNTKDKNLKPSLKKSTMFSLVFSYKKYISLLIIFTVVANLTGLIIPRLISTAIDSFSSGQFLTQIVLIQFISVTVLVFIFTYLQNILQVYASERVGKDLREQLAAKISEQQYSFVQRITPEKLLTNLTSDVDAVKLFVSHAVGSIISSLCLIFGASFLLLITNWKLALVVLLIIPVVGITFFVIFGRVKKLFMKGQGIIDQLNKVISESILGSAIIRVLHAEANETEKFILANTGARNIGLEILSYFSVLIPVITLVAGLATAAVLVLGGHFVIEGSMSLGNIAAFNSYIGILIFPILMIGFMSSAISRSSASYERINEVLLAQPTHISGTKKIPLTGNIELSHVYLTFGEKPVLKDISIHIKPGTKTAIIGPTAAGKTQLLYILHGLVPPTNGEILYDGVPIAELDQKLFHSQIGFVFQDSIIFNVSLKENIAFSQIVSDENMTKAINAAELASFIKSLPDKLETVVSERGTSLSGGQKQRLMLARALALNPTVVFLDDFTARVDTNTERKILENVTRLYPGLTLVSVTQKIGSVIDYDQIILLMEGEVIAIGTHKHLMRTSPEYVQFFESQHSTSHYEVQT